MISVVEELGHCGKFLFSQNTPLTQYISVANKYTELTNIM